MRIRHHVVGFDAADLAAESAFWAGGLDGEVDVPDGRHMGLAASANQPEHLKPIAAAIAEAEGREHVPVTFERCGHVSGPFFHGTSREIAIGDELVPGHPSNFQEGRVANHVYFSALLEPAVWGAELASALATGRPHVYVVEPTGPFEDDPNVTDKKFPGNVTRSYRTRHPVRVVAEVDDWEGHPPEVLQGMLDHLAELRAAGLDVIED